MLTVPDEAQKKHLTSFSAGIRLPGKLLGHSHLCFLDLPPGEGASYETFNSTGVSVRRPSEDGALRAESLFCLKPLCCSCPSVCIMCPVDFPEGPTCRTLTLQFEMDSPCQCWDVLLKVALLGKEKTHRRSLYQLPASAVGSVPPAMERCISHITVHGEDGRPSALRGTLTPAMHRADLSPTGHYISAKAGNARGGRNNGAAT